MLVNVVGLIARVRPRMASAVPLSGERARVDEDGTAGDVGFESAVVDHGAGDRQRAALSLHRDAGADGQGVAGADADRVRPLPKTTLPVPLTVSVD